VPNCHAAYHDSSSVSARQRSDSCVVKTGLCLSILAYLLDWSLFFLHLLFLFLLFRSTLLLFYFFGTSSFSLPVFSFFLFGHVPSCSVWPALCVGLAALCLLPVWFRGAVLCRLGRPRCMRLVDIMFFLGVLLARTPVPTATVSPLPSRQRGTLYLPVIDLAPRGEGGMVASAEEAESSAAPPARTAPLRSSPSSALPEDSSHGSRERKNSFMSPKRPAHTHNRRKALHL